MLAFLRRHWLIYLIGAAVAVALGLGASYVVGVIGSTPESVREDQVESEEQQADELNKLSSEESGSAADTSGGDSATME